MLIYIIYVDWDAVRRKLDSMSKEELQKYINEKGNRRKKDLYDVCIFQTTDAMRTKVLADSMERQFELAKDRQDQFNKRLESYNTEKVQAVDRIDECERNIEAKKAELQECEKDDPTSHKAKAATAREQIDEKMIKNINKIFETESPVNLVNGLESLVGLLRNVRKANNIDVELFFKEHLKLVNNLKRKESTNLTYSNVKLHHDELVALFEEFKKPLSEQPEPVQDEKNPKAARRKKIDIQPFAPLIEWGVEFSTAAEMELRKETLEKEIEKLEAEKEKCNLKIQRIDAVSDDIAAENMAEYYESQVKTLMENSAEISMIASTDQSQAVDYQKKLHGFEKKYFDKLLEAVRNQ